MERGVDIFRILKNLESETNRSNASLELINTYIYCLFLLLTQDFLDAMNMPGLIKRFFTLVENNMMMSVKDYADKLNISSNYLNEIVKKHTDLTANQVIKQFVIRKSKFLLSAHNHTIESTAYEIGFKDPSYFCKFFKRSTDLTPAQYRKDIKNNHHGTPRL